MCQRSNITVEKNLGGKGSVGPVERIDDILFRRVNTPNGPGAIVLGEMVGHPAAIIIGKSADGTLVKAKLTMAGRDDRSIPRTLWLFNEVNDTINAWRKLPFIGRMMNRVVGVETEVKVRPVIPMLCLSVGQKVADHIGCDVANVQFKRSA